MPYFTKGNQKSMYGYERNLVDVNKMDLVGWSNERIFLVHKKSDEKVFEKLWIFYFMLWRTGSKYILHIS